MLVRCWGSRGSIPVSGPEYCRYGGDTTCVEVRSREGDLIILDAGTGIRNLGDRLIREKTRKVNILFTHLHLDHIMGLPFFNPIYNRKFSINIYGCPFKVSSFETALHGIMKSPYFPVDLRQLPARVRFKDIMTKSFNIGSVKIKPIYLNHPNGGLGYRLEENGKVFVFLTDNELGYDLPGSQPFEYYQDFCRGADLLIHDAEFDREEYKKFRAWGHSMYTEAVELGIKAGVKRLGLFHIHNRRTDTQLESFLKDSKRIIDKNGCGMECFIVGNQFEINV
ncbi:MAG: MBL fold metallo-hydrolase [Fibrobacter sp.]|nr:MBL fold metallo-hydrolase [Fibrobacter sp.]